MNDFVPWLIEFMRSIDPLARTLLAGLAVMLETSILIGLVFPGDTVVLVASIGITSALQGIAMVIAVVVGALIGESIGFGLGRWIGPHIRASWVGRRVGEHNWVRAERYLARRGGIAIFLSRFLPVLHSLVPLTVGMSHYSYRRFLAWTAPACLVWATAYVSITSLAVGSFDELADQVHFAGYIFVGIIIVFLLLVLLSKKVIARMERRHLDSDDAEAGTDVKD
ncbi:DedA family protein [Microbacterium sp. ZW T6_19]|uniref:DedA family protein n=1 Tax=Microbacterium sp. ZW T6_19 TaxID=3378082 RepID=UPI00385328D2